MPSSSFKYENLAQKLLKQIAVARLQPGDRLPTEDELVREHGLSRITVRRALHILESGGYVSRRRKRGTVVARAIEGSSELHLVRGTVVIIISNTAANLEEDHALASLLRGIESTLADQGFGVQILGVGKDLAMDRSRIMRLIERGGLEGFCAVGSCIDPYRDLLGAVPMIYSCTFTPNGTPWIGYNIRDAANVCANYLLDHGHHQIALICGPQIDSKAFGYLVSGYKQAFDDRHVPYDRMSLQHAYDGESLEELAEQVLLRSAPPSAVLSQDWRVTRAFIKACQKLGRRIPGDLSIIGIGQNTLFVPSPVAITAYIPDNERVGREVAKTLIKLVDKQPIDPKPNYVPGQLIERDSVARRPS